MRKTILIGIDGASPDLLLNWIKEDKLPNFKKILEKGSFGKLESTIPPFSAPAWTSIITGCSPGKHKIYGFESTGTLKPQLVSSKYRGVPAIWNYLTKINLRNIIINVPGSYPPEQINGVMITGLLTPSWDSNFTYPKDIKQRLKTEDLGPYILEKFWIEDFSRSRMKKKTPEKLLQNIIDQMTSRYETAIKLMKESNWHFTMIVFRGTDTIQHFFFENKDFLIKTYQKIDELIGKIMKEYPNATYFIVSDHGFEEIKKILYPDNILYNSNYLTPKNDPYENTVSQFTAFLFKIIYWFLRILPHKYIKKSDLIRKLLFTHMSKSKIIDFSKSKAFSTADGRGIQICDNGKNDPGIIGAKGYKKLCNEIKRLFLKLKDPKDNSQIIKKIYHYTEIYGKDAISPPDLVFELDKGVTAAEGIFFPNNIGDIIKFEKRKIPYIIEKDILERSGDHSPFGIFFVFGENIKSKYEIKKISVMDVLPTIFASMGLSIPKIIDGKTKDEIFIKKPEIREIDWDFDNIKDTLLKTSESKKIRELSKKIREKS